MNVLPSGHSVGIGQNDGIGQVQLGQVQGGFGQLDVRVVLLQTLGKFLLGQQGRLFLALQLFVAGLGGGIVGLYPVKLLGG